MTLQEEWDRIRSYCTGCLKLDPEYLTCSAFSKPHPLWGKGECWAREENPEKYRQQMTDIREYIYRKTGNPIGPRRYNWVSEEEKKAELKKFEGLDEVYHEEVHKPLRKPPHGEKQDRTHKLFGKDRMKDNRFVIPTDRL